MEKMKHFLSVLLVINFSFFLLGFSNHNMSKENKLKVCILKTNYGKMIFKFFENEAPKTCKNFQHLVKKGFYNGKEFYRVVKGHVIQAGSGGDNDYPTVKAEFNNNPHITGAVGLARDENPDSGNTEFYICLSRRKHLDGKYTVFGQLIEGFDVLKRIGNTEVEKIFTGKSKNIAFHKPKNPVFIKKAKIEFIKNKTKNSK